MDWQRELGRAAYWGRNSYANSEGIEVIGVKRMYVKRICRYYNAIQSANQKVFEDRDADAKELVEDTCAKVSLYKQGSKVKNHLHQQQTSTVKKFKETEPKKNRARTGQPKASLDGADVGEVYMRRCKKQSTQANSELKLRHQEDVASKCNQQATGWDQPISTRQRRIPRPLSDKERAEQVEKTLKRKQDSETAAAAAANLLTSKGTKRSVRVAHRVVHEEPPPLPLKLPKLHLVLTRKEVHEDWIKITGHKYTGKPKKSTLVQRGLGLCTALTCPSSIKYLNGPQ